MKKCKFCSYLASELEFQYNEIFNDLLFDMFDHAWKHIYIWARWISCHKVYFSTLYQESECFWTCLLCTELSLENRFPFLTNHDLCEFQSRMHGGIYQCQRFVMHCASLTCNSTRPQHTLPCLQSTNNGFYSLGSGGIEKSHSCKWAKWIQSHALPHIQQSTQQRNKGYYPNLHGWDFSIPPSPITGFKSLPGLPGVKGLIAAYIWRNPNSSNSHPHRICNFRTLISGSDSNGNDQYGQLKRFIVRDLTNWANENHKLANNKRRHRNKMCLYDLWN